MRQAKVLVFGTHLPLNHEFGFEDFEGKIMLVVGVSFLKSGGVEDIPPKITKHHPSIQPKDSFIAKCAIPNISFFKQFVLSHGCFQKNSQFKLDEK